jgi:hypothetical protein
LAKQNVLLAEPDRDAFTFKQVVQLRSDTAPVVPRMAEEEVAEFGLLTSQVDLAPIRIQRPDLVRSVRDR